MERRRFAAAFKRVAVKLASSWEPGDNQQRCLKRGNESV